MFGFIRQCLVLTATLLAGGAMADGVSKQLALDAEYCTILRAFTDGADAHCPATPRLGLTRGVSRAAIPPDNMTDARGYFIHFAFDSDDLSNPYQEHLQKLSSVLQSEAMADLCLLLVGHTDAVGTKPYNQRLSERRARSVHLYLEAVAGIAGGRMQALGQGETSPLAGVPPSDSRNRRVEILAKPRTGTDCA